MEVLDVAPPPIAQLMAFSAQQRCHTTAAEHTHPSVVDHPATEPHLRYSLNGCFFVRWQPPSARVSRRLHRSLVVAHRKSQVGASREPAMPWYHFPVFPPYVALAMP
jgi:hypothetical protein